MNRMLRIVALTATCGTHAHWKRGCWRCEDAPAHDTEFPRAVAGRNAGSAQVRWIHRSVADTGITGVRCQARLDVWWKPRNPAGLHHHPAHDRVQVVEWQHREPHETRELRVIGEDALLAGREALALAVQRHADRKS